MLQFVMTAVVASMEDLIKKPPSAVPAADARERELVHYYLDAMASSQSSRCGFQSSSNDAAMRTCDEMRHARLRAFLLADNGLKRYQYQLLLM